VKKIFPAGATAPAQGTQKRPPGFPSVSEETGEQKSSLNPPNEEKGDGARVVSYDTRGKKGRIGWSTGEGKEKSWKRSTWQEKNTNFLVGSTKKTARVREMKKKGGDKRRKKSHDAKRGGGGAGHSTGWLSKGRFPQSRGEGGAVDTPLGEVPEKGERLASWSEGELGSIRFRRGGGGETLAGGRN